MKKTLTSLGIFFIFLIGCGPTKRSSQEVAIPTVKPTPKLIAVNPSVREQDMKYGDRPMSSGTGKSLFQRQHSPKARQVIHQVKKGFWIGGEK